MKQPIRLLSSMAPRALLKELSERYYATSRQAILCEAAGGVDVARRVRAAEPVDLVVAARNTIEELAREGHLRNEISDIAQSGIAVAVKSTAPAPDVSTVDLVRTAVIEAPSISYSTGPSGVYLEECFRSWGILDALQARIVVPPPGVPVASLLATGTAALGFQQLSELVGVPGIKVVGPLPKEIQLLTVFAGAMTRSGTHGEIAKRFLEFMISPELDDVRRQFGMDAAQ